MVTAHRHLGMSMLKPFCNSCKVGEKNDSAIYLCPLHAATPDLLAALKAVEAVIKEAETPGDVWTAKRLMVALGPKVRAAIAKAQAGS